MKKVLLIVSMLISIAVFSQDDRRPEKVRRQFDKDYPNTNAQWDMKNGYWHGHYRDNNNRDVDVYYDRYGRRRDSYIVWDRSNVPAAIDRAIYRRYHAKDYQVMRVERPRGSILFQITIGNR